MDCLEFVAWVTSHIPDKGQVMVRYYGLYANAHRGKVRKTSIVEVDPMLCPKCGAAMKVVAFLTDFSEYFS